MSALTGNAYLTTGSVNGSTHKKENMTDDGDYPYYDGNLTDYLDELQCAMKLMNESLPDGKYCNGTYDSFLCWSAAPANTTVYRACPAVTENVTDARASRHCAVNGTWTNSGKTDYQICIDYITKNDQDEIYMRIATMMRDIYFVGSVISLFLLLVTLFIFCYFRALQCNRISIHKNLVVSFILRFVVMIIMMAPFISKKETSYRDVDWLCKLFTVLNQYTMMANIFWMLVEGIFLHNRIAVAVFSTDAPFVLFYVIGWGFPGVVAVTWAIVVEFYHGGHCWEDYSQTPYTYIIIVPFVTAIALNLIFLINIIRILITKLRANNTVESAQIRKAIKATIVLFPLLGLTNLIFFINPEDKKGLQIAYHATNAVLHSTQGVLVTIFYCFLNGEVRRVIKQKWYRLKVRRVLHNGRRRSSRTSSFFLSQTETQAANQQVPNQTSHTSSKNNSTHSNLNSHSKTSSLL